jgi:hypothetical protein
VAWVCLQLWWVPQDAPSTSWKMPACWHESDSASIVQPGAKIAKLCGCAKCELGPC